MTMPTPRTRTSALVAGAILAAAAAPLHAQAGDGARLAAASPAAAARTPAADTTVAPTGRNTATLPAAGIPVRNLELRGTMHVWYSGHDRESVNGFRIRRAELKLLADLGDAVRVTVMVDPAKTISLSSSYVDLDGTRVVREARASQASNMLQDAYVSIRATERWRLDVGQYRVPLGLEGLEPSARLDLVERTRFASDRARAGSLSGARDLGVSAAGAFGPLQLQLGAFNGSGEAQNASDSDEGKAFIGRVVLEPRLIPGLHVGASGAWASGDGETSARRDRLGAELQYGRGRLGVKGEAMHGWDGDARRLGWYAQGSWRLRPAVQLVARLDSWDPDTELESSTATVVERDWLGGVNWTASDVVRVQLTAGRRTFGGGYAASTVGLANVQVAW